MKKKQLARIQNNEQLIARLKREYWAEQERLALLIFSERSARFLKKMLREPSFAMRVMPPVKI